MRIKTLATTVAILTVAMTAGAEQPADFRDYFEGPEGFLITKKEKKAWKKTVKTAAQAEEYIELFWAKRDPDLTTPLNEFKEDFDLRVAAADDAFGYEEVRGALTDRGRVLILLGRPIDRIQREPGADPTDNGRASGGVEDGGFGGGVGPGDFPTTGDDAGGGVGQASPMGGPPPGSSELEMGRERGAIEVWVYDPRSLSLRVNQKAVPVFFRETRFGMGDYPLVKDNPRNTMAMRVLSAAPEGALRHPNLSSVPRYGLIQGTQPATEQQLAWFAADDRPWPEGADVVVSEGLYIGPRHFFWAHLHLPAGAPERVTAIGRLRNEDTGEVTGSFQQELEGLELEGGRGYELSIPVAKGSWALELAMAGSDGPKAVTELSLETTEVPMDATVFSPFYWGTEVLETEDAKMGDPFNVGGWHVAPRFSKTMSTDEELTYMAYVLQPKVERGSQPHFEVTLTLYEDGKRIARGTPRQAQLSQVAPDMWMFGGSIELVKFTEPGNFEIKVELSQQTDGAKQEIKIPFIIEGEEAPEE